MASAAGTVSTCAAKRNAQPHWFLADPRVQRLCVHFGTLRCACLLACVIVVVFRPPRRQEVTRSGWCSDALDGWAASSSRCWRLRARLLWVPSLALRTAQMSPRESAIASQHVPVVGNIHPEQWRCGNVLCHCAYSELDEVKPTHVLNAAGLVSSVFLCVLLPKRRCVAAPTTLTRGLHYMFGTHPPNTRLAAPTSTGVRTTRRRCFGTEPPLSISSSTH